MSKDKRGRKCKGRHCAWCKPVTVCGKSIGLGRNGVGYCGLLKGHDGGHRMVVDIPSSAVDRGMVRPKRKMPKVTIVTMPRKSWDDITFECGQWMRNNRMTITPERLIEHFNYPPEYFESRPWDA